MGSGTSEAERLLDLAAERGLIPRSAARELKAEAGEDGRGGAVGEWLIRRDVLTAEQVAELRSALDTLGGDGSRTGDRGESVPTVVLPGAFEKTAELPQGPAEVGPPEAPLLELEDYRIVGRLGEGGMGVVWCARQLSTRREVALKLLPAASVGSERARRRFEREVELTARLEHPNIARLYDSGLHRGVYYYAMELVDGVPLDRYVTKNGLSQGEILRLMQTVCEAVDYAHGRGVVHRA
ncbi:MAG: protein kinase domain-containing protein [Planctomycetota bacterium]